jgi:hypothetical protein
MCCSHGSPGCLQNQNELQFTLHVAVILWFAVSLHKANIWRQHHTLTLEWTPFYYQPLRVTGEKRQRERVNVWTSFFGVSGTRRENKMISRRLYKKIHSSTWQPAIHMATNHALNKSSGIYHAFVKPKWWKSRIRFLKSGGPDLRFAPQDDIWSKSQWTRKCIRISAPE